MLVVCFRSVLFAFSLYHHQLSPLIWTSSFICFPSFSMSLSDNYLVCWRKYVTHAQHSNHLFIFYVCIAWVKGKEAGVLFYYVFCVYFRGLIAYRLWSRAWQRKFKTWIYSNRTYKLYLCIKCHISSWHCVFVRFSGSNEFIADVCYVMFYFIYRLLYLIYIQCWLLGNRLNFDLFGWSDNNLYANKSKCVARAFWVGMTFFTLIEYSVFVCMNMMFI